MSWSKMIKIRKTTIKDLEDIQELNHKLCEKENMEFDSTINPNFSSSKEGEQHFRRCLIDKNKCVLIALDGKKTLGYLSGGISKPEDYRKLSKIGVLGSIFVLEEYRKKGVGTKLHNSFISWCNKKRVDRIRVVASAKNFKAINFYKKNKFKEYNVILETE